MVRHHGNALVRHHGNALVRHHGNKTMENFSLGFEKGKKMYKIKLASKVKEMNFLWQKKKKKNPADVKSVVNVNHILMVEQKLC